MASVDADAALTGESTTREPAPAASTPRRHPLGGADRRRGFTGLPHWACSIRARDRVGAPLRNAKPFTEAVQTGGTTLHRARFSGFETQSEARDACRQLERQGGSPVFASRS